MILRAILYIISASFEDFFIFFLDIREALEDVSHAQTMRRADTAFVSLSIPIRFSLGFFQWARPNVLYNLYYYPGSLFCDLEGSK
jgi:hypothetical protein